MNYKHSPFPLWGPYSKKYAGISKVTNADKYPAARFDLTTVPGVMGFDIRVPNVTLPTAYHPWLAAPDYNFFAFRHDLEWKDVVYADVSYTRLNENSTLIRTELTNNTDIVKNFVINYFYSLELPVGRPFEPALPDKCEFINACDYTSYDYAIRRPWDEQNCDAMKKGCFPDERFFGGHGLGDRCPKWHMPHKVLKPFGGEKGDNVCYNTEIKNSYTNPVLVARYRTSDIHYEQGKMVGVKYINSKNTAKFNVLGTTLELAPSNELTYATVELPEVTGNIQLVSQGTGAAEFDFFVICEKEDAAVVTSKMCNEADKVVPYIPETTVKQTAGGWQMHSKYPVCEDEFFLNIAEPNTRFRKVETGSLEDCMSARMSNADESFDDLTESFTGAFNRKHSDDGFYENAITHTIFVQPHSTAVRYAVVSDKETDCISAEEAEKAYTKAKENAVKFTLSKDGEKYGFSNQLLAAAVLTNVVYPIYKHGEYIIHPTPGKRWDCLYTWDLGFIGLGTNEYAPEICNYILDTYLSDESNPDYAFLHHGSPVPTQIYQFLEMAQKTNDKQKLLALYPRLRLYYRFLSGKIRGSTTNKFKSDLLTTYDYFYSTSGMDDYPAQVAMMNDNIRDTTSPVLTSGTVIRFGKIISMIADKLGFENDVAEYTADIERFTQALDKYAWDEASGYFSYVRHDSDYNPVGFYQTKDGENLSKGLDGIYPIIAGACTEHQKQAILSHLKSEKEMLSPYGISAVDQTASYFRVNGYWNGNIWFPHQWIIWKSMLDMGESEFAFEIAKRALNIWKREVESTYYTFEMVSVVTGNGGWFHNFGGLSTPINLWTKAYYQPGTLNVGFDTWVENQSFSNDFTSLEAEMTYYGKEENITVLATMKAGQNYTATVDGMDIPVTMRTDSCAELTVPVNSKKSFKLKIYAQEKI